MDPQALLVTAETKLAQHEYAEALEALLVYYDWRVKGGFQPPRGDYIASSIGPRLIDAITTPRRERLITREHVETLAKELNKPVIDMVTELQGAAAALKDEETLDVLCEIKDAIIDEILAAKQGGK